MARTSSARMILTLLMVIWVEAGIAVAFNADVQPMDPIVLNGTDLTLNCTLAGPLDGQTASDVNWVACTFPMGGCGAVAADHSVEVEGNRTSLLHLRTLRMPQKGEREGMTYRCCFDCDALPSYGTLVRTATRVYVGIPPYPVENLRCLSRDKENFTCSWEREQYTGLGVKATYVQYKQRIGDNDWSEMKLDRNALSFTGQTAMYEMEIRVTQENPLGNSTTSMVHFARAEDTIPNPPEGVELRFLPGENGTVDMQVTWELPRQWLPKNQNLLQYKVEFKSSKMAKPTTEDVYLFYLQFTVREIEPYTTYTARVICKLNGAGNWSEWSPLVTGVSPEAAPTGEVNNLGQSVLGMNPDPYKRDVQLTWQPPSSDQQNGIIRGYQMYISSGSPPDIVNVSLANNVYELRGIDKFQEYDVRVAAYTTEGAVGPFTELVIPDLTRMPAKAENLVAVSEASDRILVTWDKPSNPQGVILRYTVKWNEVDPLGIVYISEVRDPTNRRFLIEELLPYRKYNVMVIVHNKAGESQADKELKTQFSRPTLPRNLGHRKASSTVIDLSWDRPESLNGPLLGYEVHYWPSGDPSHGSVNKSVSVTQAVLDVNCSAFQEAVQFTFQVFAVTGLDEGHKLLGPPTQLEKEMCGADYPITSIMIGVLISAFSILCLIFCLYTFRQSSLMKPSPGPRFIDGILEHSSDKFTSRFPTRPQEKEYFDVLKTSESVHELVGQRSNVTSNKSSLSSSSGSSDQGFHDMQSDAEHYNVAFGSDHRRPNGHSELDVERGQRVLSPTEEHHEDEVPVFSCPEDGDDIVGPVNSYQTQTPTSPPASPASVHIPMDDGRGVQYTSRRESTAGRSGSSASPHRFSSGSESGSMTYLQLGANQLPLTSPKESRRQDPGEESDTNYSQMAMHGAVSVQTPPYESVWPSESTPEKSDSHDGDLDPDWINGFRTDLGFNNNSKDIPDIHAAGAFKAPQEIIVATALSPQTPNSSTAPREVSPLLPKLSSTDSDDYIDVIGGSCSPRANASHISSPLISPRSKTDAGCMDYVLQSELPPASPQESSVL
ncbi:interleukin-12 receptor subunit beta-2-like isoform X2 [Patiria miniata]|nr:interleukin-12 receptor subunit beta-2-like isoform X2 [Patiria miniata]